MIPTHGRLDPKRGLVGPETNQSSPLMGGWELEGPWHAHAGNSCWLRLQHAWESRGLRVGWTLWFITARALMDFFFRRDRKKDRDGKYQDDILASDYLEAGAWQSVAKGLTPPKSYDQVREAANKLSAHLTYSRVDLREEGGIPPSAAVHEFLLGTAAVWLEKLEPRRRVWFGRGLPSGSD